MTPLFLARLFEERSAVCTPSHGAQFGRDAQYRMDYASFLQFVFAWEHRDEPAALRHFFPLFDLGGKGCITQVFPDCPGLDGTVVHSSPDSQHSPYYHHPALLHMYNVQ